MTVPRLLNFDAVPQPLRELPQWVCWRFETRDGKSTKIPYSPANGQRASTSDTKTWSTFENAVAAYQRADRYDGIGFVFSEADPFCGIDLDGCLADGRWLWGDDLVEWLDTYAEVSPSGRGVKLILRARKPQHARSVKRGMGDNGSGAIEIYDRARFFAITANTLEHTPAGIGDRQPQLEALCDYFWPKRPSPRPEPTTPTPPQNHENVEQRAIAYLNAMPPAISGSGGHIATISAATALVHGFGIAPDCALELLKAHFNPRCEPEWTEAELRHKVQDAAATPHPHPFGWLRDAAGDKLADGVDLSCLLTKLTTVNSTPEPAPSGRRCIVKRLCDVKHVPLKWLWPGRIPLGKLTLLAGDPGLGKSFLTLDMAARVSRGTPWPDLPLLRPDCGSVILFNAEDDLEDTIVPRLIRADADRTKILSVEGVELCDPSKLKDKKEPLQWFFSLDNDLPQLEELLVENPDTLLVVIDPVSAYCGEIDTHKNAEVRAMLAPLANLAGKHHVAVLCVTHLSKTGGTKAVYRSMGSLAFAAAARAVWAVAKDVGDPCRRLLLPAKLNLAHEPDGLAFRIDDGRVVWEHDPVPMHADDAFAAEAAAAESRPRGRERQEAQEWLKSHLAAGPLPAAEVLDVGKELGFTQITLRRAYKEMGGQPRKCNFHGGWVWELPGLFGRSETVPADRHQVASNSPVHLGNFQVAVEDDHFAPVTSM